MSHTIKLYERVIDIRMRRCTSILENLFGFVPRRSTMEVVHHMRQIMEYYCARKRDLYWFLLNLKKHTTRYQNKYLGGQ